MFVFFIILLLPVMFIMINFADIVDWINRPAEVNPFGKYTLYRKTIGGEDFYYAKVRVCRIFPIYRVFRAIDTRVNGLNGRANAITIRKQFLWLDKKSLIERLNYEYKEESNRKKVKKELKSKGKRIHA